MNIMLCRLNNLQHALAGLIKTGVPLIFYDGQKLVPFDASDDIGIYYFIPRLACFFNISLEQSIAFFFNTMLACSFIAAFVGFWCLYRTLFSRIFITAELSLLLFFIIRTKTYDVYLTYIMANLCLIPLFLYLFFKKNNSAIFDIFLIIGGVIIGSLHYIRAFSALGAGAFIVCMIILNHQFSGKKKSFLLSCLLGGLLLSVCYFQNIIYSYQSAAKKIFTNYSDFPIHHPFWHSIYIGFGFLKFLNDDNIEYADQCGTNKVQQPITAHNFNEYENYLKNEVALLWKKKKVFFLFTIFAKIGVLILFFLFFTNIGIIHLFFTKSWAIECSFIASFICNSLPCLLAVPCFAYGVGFITLSTIYCIVSICTISRQELVGKLFTLKKIMGRNIFFNNA